MTSDPTPLELKQKEKKNWAEPVYLPIWPKAPFMLFTTNHYHSCASPWMMRRRRSTDHLILFNVCIYPLLRQKPPTGQKIHQSSQS